MSFTLIFMSDLNVKYRERYYLIYSLAFIIISRTLTHPWKFIRRTFFQISNDVYHWTKYLLLKIHWTFDKKKKNAIESDKPNDKNKKWTHRPNGPCFSLKLILKVTFFLVFYKETVFVIISTFQTNYPGTSATNKRFIVSLF